MAFSFSSGSFLANEAGPLDRLLRRRFPGASWSAIRRLVESGKVSVAGAAVRRPGAPVLAGALLEIQMTRPRSGRGPAGPTELVVFSDADIVVVRKPAGLSTIEHAGEPSHLLEQAESWLARQQGRPCAPLLVVHRLDKVTSGLLVFARHRRAQEDLRQQFRSHSTEREYLALVHGRPEPGTLRFRIVRNRGDGLRGVTSDPQAGQASVTHVASVEQLPRHSLVRCRLETGRTHQIRIHLAHVGCPVVGDPFYGPERLSTDSQSTLLHAAQLSVIHPRQGRRLWFREPLPPRFEAFLRRERGASSPRSARPRLEANRL